jgi:Mrp family chromosome partitioning ATPase
MVTSLSSLGKRRDYAVLGAAPDLSDSALRELPPDHRTPLGCLAFQPASPFATAFRDLQGALAGAQVVAFIASAPNEGASTVALCTAVAAVQQSQRVILLDCDARRRSFTAALEHEPTAGLNEACLRPDTWRNYLDEEVETGLHFIPAAHQANPRNLSSTAGLPALIEHLRGDYDLIVLDCPPALGDTNGAAIARMADQCVVVAAWDETPISALRNTIRSLRSGGRLAPSVYVNRVPSGYRFGRLRPQ